MKNWKNVTNEFPVDRMFKRGCDRKNVSSWDRRLFDINEVRYQSDGYTTLAVVTVSEPETVANIPMRKRIFVHGYGIAVCAEGDKFNEGFGASKALNRAFENAATIIKQRLAKLRKNGGW